MVADPPPAPAPMPYADQVHSGGQKRDKLAPQPAYLTATAVDTPTVRRRKRVVEPILVECVGDWCNDRVDS
eukprot:g21078.t1